MLESGHFYSQEQTQQFETWKNPSQRSETTRLAKKVVQYELSFDREKAAELQALRGTENYEEEEKAFEGFIAMQLVTALGERFNRGISEYSYQARDGKLYGEHSDEPFEHVLERGRAYREIHGDPLDHPREQAEVDGFRKIQEVLTSDEIPEGTVMVSVSPPGEEGSIYKHNFYDAFQKMSDGTVRVIRFSNALTAEETVEKLQELDPTLPSPTELSDVSLLSNPFVLLTNYPLTLEGLHQHLHREHDIMSEADFQKITDVCNALISSYIATLKAYPDDERRQGMLYNAILNKADQVADSLKDNTFYEQYGNAREWQYSHDDIAKLAVVPVRSVDTGCGFSGGFTFGGESSAVGPYSVAMRPENDPNLCKKCPGAKPHFHCGGDKVITKVDDEGNKEKKVETCDYKVIVGSGTTRCPECGQGKRC